MHPVNHRRALFLDRDGVVNVDHGYVHRKEEVEFLDGIFDVVAHAVGAGYLVIIVTNQAGIGRGYYTEADFFELDSWMCAQFAARGGKIHKTYFCPDHPEHGIGPYRKDSDCRKPKPGMLLAAARDFSLDLSRCVLIGDKETDLVAGLAAGVGCNLLLSPGGGGSARSGPCFVIAGLREATRFLRPVG